MEVVKGPSVYTIANLKFVPVPHLILNENVYCSFSLILSITNPSLNRTTFTQEDDNYIIHLYNKYGPKWSFIVQFFTNRTADMIKNRFHSSIKKKLSNDSNMSTRMTSFDDVIPNTNISLHSDLIFLSEQENNSIEPIILNKEAEQETITNNDSLDLFNDDEYFNF